LPAQTRQSLRLLSYNIEAGVASERYRDYLTRGWRYLVPHDGRWRRLQRIAKHLAAYDIVALQETDAGSFRTGFSNTTEYLARQAEFPFWFEQVNRRLGAISSHGNGLLCRIRPREVADRKLPGLRGRGVLIARFDVAGSSLAILVVHLALGKRARRRQMARIAELVNAHRHAIVMGDLNCDSSSRELKRLLRTTPLEAPGTMQETFPSWNPRRGIDHILVTSAIRVTWAEVPRWLLSDHYPVAVNIQLPGRLSC